MGFVDIIDDPVGGTVSTVGGVWGGSVFEDQFGKKCILFGAVCSG